MTANRILTMSKDEVKRSEITRMADEKRITQHFRRLLKRYRKQGPEGIVVNPIS